RKDPSTISQGGSQPILLDRPKRVQKTHLQLRTASSFTRLSAGAQISGNESAVQRYFNAFENGRLPEARVATRDAHWHARSAKGAAQRADRRGQAESRASIIPTLRLAAPPVRVTEAVVGRGGLAPPTSAFSA